MTDPTAGRGFELGARERARPKEAPVTIELSTERLFRYAVLAVLVTVAAHIVLNVLQPDFLGAGILRRVFRLDREQSIPTYLASTLLATTALTLAVISRRSATRSSDRWSAPYWLGLALLFGLASVDEVATLHEQLTDPVRSALGLSGMLRFSWVLPVGAALVVLGLVFLRFWWRLPAPTRTGFAAGAAVFVLGAIGVELPGAYVYDTIGQHTTAYRLLTTLEEILEFTGTLIMLGTFLAHLRRRYAGAHLRVR